MYYGAVQFYQKIRGRDLPRLTTPKFVVVRADGGSIETAIGNWEKKPIERSTSNGDYDLLKGYVPLRAGDFIRFKDGYSGVFGSHFEPEQIFREGENPFSPGTYIRIQPRYDGPFDGIIYVEIRVRNGDSQGQNKNGSKEENIEDLIHTMLNGT